MTDFNHLIINGLDTETTGFIAPDHRLVEIYSGLWRGGKKIFEYDQRIDPQRAIPADAQRVHGITASDLIGKPTWETVAPTVQKILSKSHLMVAHNAEFDWGFLKQEFDRIGLPLPDIAIFDTMSNGVWATPDGKQPSLQELCFACEVEYDTTKAHAASYDVDVMMECFFKGLEWGFFEIPEHLLMAQAA